MSSSTMATPLSLEQRGYPIWLWLQNNSSFGAGALESLLSRATPSQSLDGFISFLKTKVVAERQSCLCVKPEYVTKSKLNFVFFSHIQQLPGLPQQRPGRIVVRPLAFHKSPLCPCGACDTRAHHQTHHFFQRVQGTLKRVKALQCCVR
jgi:hypothetical protein